MRAVLATIFLIALIAPMASATVVINSEDWRDVYTGLQYAALEDRQGFFVVDSQQGADLATRLPPNEPILLITGRDQSMPGFRQLITSRGYEIEERIESTDAIDTNQELALRAQPENLVLVDDAYGYNALSVATYAKVWNASVLFAEPGVTAIIDEVQPQGLLLYGHIPSALLTDLSGYDYEVINEQDKFEDNFALVERFQEYSPRQTIILSNGEFIEQQLITDVNPVLFIGRQNVPAEVIDFLNEQGFRISVLVGNALAPNAQYIKDETGMSLFIKFAQGRNEQQFALDLYQLPIPNPLITLQGAEYDPTTQELLVTYQNPGEVSTYFTGSFETGQGVVEDDEPTFIEAGTYKTLRYSTPPPESTVDYTILYGASPVALELILQGSVDVDEIDIRDSSEITITGAVYDPGSQEFRVTLQNPSAVDAYALVELVDVRIGQDRVRLGGEVISVRSGSEGTVDIPAELTENDLERNQELQIEVFYGEREFSLIKFTRATLGFSIEESSIGWTWIVVVVFIALLLMWYIGRRR